MPYVGSSHREYFKYILGGVTIRLMCAHGTTFTFENFFELFGSLEKKVEWCILEFTCIRT